MIDFVAAVAEESQRFARAVDQAVATGVEPAEVRVPPCPEWSLADLVWHLAGVQHFWASIVAGGLDDPSAVTPLERPTDAGLGALFERCSRRLVTAIGDHEPDRPCWSWFDDGHSVGWVRRRQAHEALIHRIDAELALATVAPRAVPEPVDETLAADGIDEIITVMMEARSLPPWADWEPDGETARIDIPARIDTPARGWSLASGRVVGTDPEGEARSLPAVRQPAVDGRDPAASPSVTLRGPASTIDRWLWGRGPLAGEGVSIDGDRSVIDRLRDLAAVD